MQVDPSKSTLKAPGCGRFKLKCDDLLSNVAYNVNLRRYTMEESAPVCVAAEEDDELGRGLHSFTSQLNLSALYGIRGARRDCVARVKGVLGGVDGV